MKFYSADESSIIIVRLVVRRKEVLGSRDRSVWG